MATLTKDSATDLLFEQLMKTDGKAEIIDGEIVRLPLHDGVTSVAKSALQASLHRHTKGLKYGRVGVSTLGFAVDLPHRKSFCADVSFYDLPPAGMGFPRGAPLFAVEFRDPENSAAELAIAAKIADYFAAGTLVVWDVDLQSADIIKVHRASDLQNPTVYQRGEIAEAEPAVPKWSLEVDSLFG